MQQLVLHKTIWKCKNSTHAVKTLLVVSFMHTCMQGLGGKLKATILVLTIILFSKSIGLCPFLPFFHFHYRAITLHNFIVPQRTCTHTMQLLPQETTILSLNFAPQMHSLAMDVYMFINDEKDQTEECFLVKTVYVA